MSETIKVTGVKFFKGTIDGEAKDSGTVFVEEKLDHRKGTAKGTCTVPYSIGTSDVAQQLMRLDFPFTASAVISRVSNGSKITNVIEELKPSASSPSPSPMSRA